MGAHGTRVRCELLLRMSGWFSGTPTKLEARKTLAKARMHDDFRLYLPSQEHHAQLGVLMLADTVPHRVIILQAATIISDPIPDLGK